MFRVFRKRRAGKVRRWRVLDRNTEGLSPGEQAELERLREQQSPFRAKWGFFPK